IHALRPAAATLPSQNTSSRTSASPVSLAPVSTTTPRMAPIRSASPSARRKRRWPLAPSACRASAHNFMRARAQTWASAVAVAACVFWALLGLAKNAIGIRSLDYDHKAPLSVQQVGGSIECNVEVEDFSYASPKGGGVPVFLVIPAVVRGPF